MSRQEKERLEEMKDESKSSERSLSYLLEILKIEIELINKSMEHIIGNTQSLKNWAILTWTGSIALILGQVDLRKYFIITAIPPFLFWYVDAWWRSLQSRYAYRATEISQFLNGENLVESFKQGKLIDFVSFDPSGRNYRHRSDYQKYTSMSRTARFPEVLGFYFPLVLISIVVGLFLFYN